jgi:hypothetical protein
MYLIYTGNSAFFTFHPAQARAESLRYCPRQFLTLIICLTHRAAVDNAHHNDIRFTAQIRREGIPNKKPVLFPVRVFVSIRIPVLAPAWGVPVQAAQELAAPVSVAPAWRVPVSRWVPGLAALVSTLAPAWGVPVSRWVPGLAAPVSRWVPLYKLA